MKIALAAAVCCLLLPACSDPPPDPPKTDLPLVTLPEPTTGPYVSVAVDYHFHDIHPVDHKQIAGDRSLVFRNEGSNKHNVTIIGTDVNQDMKPGERVTIDPVSELGPPGTYKIVCRFHASQGMRGSFELVEPGD